MVRSSSVSADQVSPLALPADDIDAARHAQQTGSCMHGRVRCRAPCPPSSCFPAASNTFLACVVPACSHYYSTGG
jgi:hypothetical protein